MIKGLRFFTSKVAKRIFLLFVVCALLPIGALGLVTFGHVTRQLHDQNHRRIQQECKSLGMAILERLLFLETEMEAVAHHIRTNPDSNFEGLSDAFKNRLARRFESIAILGSDRQFRPFYGNPVELSWSSDERIGRLQSQKAIIACRDTQAGPTNIFMIRLLDVTRPGEGFLVGQVRASHLWGIGDMNTLSAMSELSVFDGFQEVLLTSIALPSDFTTHLVSKVNDSKERRFEWSYKGKEYLASSWTVFLESRYASPSWTVVLSQAKDYVLAPTTSFKKVFPLVMLMSLWLVILLSAIQIRRHLVPLEKLKEGTHLLGRGCFNTSVKITSGDEFEDLGDSFNKMSQELGKHFQALSTVDEIDRAVLASLEKEKIIEALLSRIGDICSCDNAAIGVRVNVTENTFIFSSTSRQDYHLKNGSQTLSDSDLDTLHNNPNHLTIYGYNFFPDFVKPFLAKETKSITLLPIFIKDRLFGIIVLTYSPEKTLEIQIENSVKLRVEEDLRWARQLRDQVAVALSNSHLLEELNKLSFGALTALARTVDAKSSWTAGHSERVTKLALRLGKAMNLSDPQLAILHRGALLHDIGKIGVAAAILDKTEKLTDEEFASIKRHPKIGARILEPIGAYADIICIVLGHHERYDGTGYPQGLKGEEISLGSRIVAVADVFEAVTAHRPYRPGWEIKRAIGLIKDGAGSHFDPQVVAAFLKLVQSAKEQKKATAQAAASNRERSNASQPNGESDFGVMTALMTPDYPGTKEASVENTHR